jgi:hypothetical protein
MSNTFNPRETDYLCTWGSYALGQTQKVTPALKMKLEPIKRGSTGQHVLGHFIVALEGTIKIQCADITASLIDQLCPWVSSGAYPLIPLAMNQDLYSYAAQLTLHPLDKSDTTEDLVILHASCLSIPDQIERDGMKPDVWEIEFQPYPDRTKLLASPPVVHYGYVGTTNPSP